MEVDIGLISRCTQFNPEGMVRIEVRMLTTFMCVAEKETRFPSTPPSHNTAWKTVADTTPIAMAHTGKTSLTSQNSPLSRSFTDETRAPNDDRQNENLDIK